MPQLEEPPTQEAPTLNPQLAKLFNVKVADEAPPEKEKEADVGLGDEKPVEKEADPIADKKPADTKKSDITSRLAPDFETPERLLIEKKADAPPDVEITDEMIAAQKSPKGQADMRGFRETLTRYKTEVEELRKRPAAIEDTDIKGLLETVTKERDDLLARVERTDLFSSPKFQREHVQPRDKDYAAAQGVVKESGGDPTALNRAMGMTGKARIDLLDEIREAIPSDMMKGRFDRLIESVEARTIEINEKLKDSRKTAEEDARQSKLQDHERHVQTRKQLNSLLDAAFLDLEENVGLEVLRKTGKAEYKWFDDQREEIRKVASEVYLEATPEKAAIAAVLAASAGPYRDMFLAERKARLAVEEENRELKGAEPSMKRDRAPAKEAGDGIEPTDITARLRSGFYKKS